MLFMFISKTSNCIYDSQVKALKEKAEKDAQKRAKDFDKLQKKASKSVEEEQKKLAKQREKMEKGGTVSGDGSQNQAPRPAMAFLSLRKEPKPVQGQSTKFSEIVASSDGGSGGGTAKPAYFTGVYKKVQQRKTLGGTKGPKSLGSEFKVNYYVNSVMLRLYSHPLEL